MDLIRQLRQSRDKIKDTRADYKWLQNGKLIGTFQWGWKNDKEFLISPYLQPDCSISYTSTDGQKEYAYNQHKKPVEIRQFGRSFELIGSIFKKQNPSIFKMHQTPKHLLGDYVIDIVSLTECLERMKDLSFDQLIDIIKDCNLAVNTQQTFAYICACYDKCSFYCQMAE